MFELVKEAGNVRVGLSVLEELSGRVMLEALDGYNVGIQGREAEGITDDTLLG